MMHSLKVLISDTNPLRLTWHKSKALMAGLSYGFPAKKLTVIGITGTDGKTTTVGMVSHILNASGKKTAAISTAFFQIGDVTEWNETQKTSPSPFVIQKLLKRAVGEGCTHAVLEYSSHGLVQGRTRFTWPRIAGMTNISEEHLDYHKTMHEYLKAKSILFNMVGRQGQIVLNADDRSFEVLSRIESKEQIYYGEEEPAAGYHNASHLWLENVTEKPLSATLRYDNESLPLTLPIAGRFNLMNALCAIGCSLFAGVPLQQAVDALKNFKGIPGRLERIDAGQNFDVFVDFTVTPESYRRTLSTLRAQLPSGKKLRVLCGSCGDRMKEKRPIVGQIVSELSDYCIVTNEDPYTEDPEKIIDEVWAGIDESQTEAHRISDRRDAIETILSEAEQGDIVILCGKGSDTTMWVKDGQIPWNEREIAREILTH